MLIAGFRLVPELFVPWAGEWDTPVGDSTASVSLSVLPSALVSLQLFGGKKR